MEIHLIVSLSNTDKDIIVGSTDTKFNHTELATLTADDKIKLAAKVDELKEFCMALYEKK